jgi:hypothetical protein
MSVKYICRNCGYAEDSDVAPRYCRECGCPFMLEDQFRLAKPSFLPIDENAVSHKAELEGHTVESEALIKCCGTCDHYERRPCHEMDACRYYKYLLIKDQKQTRLCAAYEKESLQHCPVCAYDFDGFLKEKCPICGQYGKVWTEEGAGISSLWRWGVNIAMGLLIFFVIWAIFEFGALAFFPRKIMWLIAGLFALGGCLIIDVATSPFRFITHTETWTRLDPEKQP